MQDFLYIKFAQLKKKQYLCSRNGEKASGKHKRTNQNISNTMKKLFTIALMAVSMTAMAQSVTPLNIQIPELKFDSLRSLYISEPTMYRASLEVLAGQYAEVDKQLKAAKTELKAEQDHSKAMGTMIKESTSLANDLIKLYSKETDEIKSMQKTIEKQQRNLTKQVALNEQSRELFSRVLEREQKQLSRSVSEVAERQRDMTDQLNELQHMQTQLQNYEAEVQQKASNLSSLEALCKERLALLKAEQKTAKAL